MISPDGMTLLKHQLDITAPKHGVQVEVDHARSVLYVHVDGITLLRICRVPGYIEVLQYFDPRDKQLDKPQNGERK